MKFAVLILIEGNDGEGITTKWGSMRNILKVFECKT